MTQEIEFLYDFGSPNAYLVDRVIPSIEALGAVRFRHVPVLLGGIFKAIGSQSPMQAYGHITAKRDYDFLEIQRFVARHSLDRYRMNPHFPVISLLAMRGAIAADALGCAAAYREVMWTGFWEQGLKMDDPAVWAEALAGAGLDSDALAAAAADQANKDALAAATARAVERGVFGVPAFFLGGEQWFGKDRLRDVVEAAGGTMPAR